MTAAQEWTPGPIDRDTIDLEPLRHHFTDAALEAALKSAIKAGLRSIRGAEILDGRKTQFR